MRAGASRQDWLSLPGVCMPVVVASLGGGDDYFDDLACTAPVTAIVDGGDGNDRLYGSEGDDQLIGGAGDDNLWSMGGDDELLGGLGNDTLKGGPGNDTEKGEAGDDLLGGLGSESHDPGSNELFGGPGVDTINLIAQQSGQRISLDDVANDGGSGDASNYHSDIERIDATPHDDTIVGTPNADWIDGEGGNDKIDSGGGDDYINASSGNDTIQGGPGRDEIMGNDGNDVIDPGAGADIAYGDWRDCDGYSCIGGADQITSQDGEIDSINCGPGGDIATVDDSDVVAQDGFASCESVTRRTTPTPAPTPAPTPSPTPVPSLPPASPVASIPRSATAAKGIRALVTCPSACQVSAVAKVSKKVAKRAKLKSRVIGKDKASLTGNDAVRVKVSAAARSKLKRFGKVSVVVVVTIKAGGTSVTTSRKVTLRF